MKQVRLDASMAEKGGYKHYMAKEIAQQPTVVGEVLSAYVKDGQITMDMGPVDFSAIDRLSIVACGTAFYAGLTAKYWFEHYARLPVDIDVASEFRYREAPFTPAHIRAVCQPVG